LPTATKQPTATQPPTYEPDAWIYSRSTLEWMLNPKLTSQLPWLYRIFSTYSTNYFKLTGASDLKGGRRLFQLLSGVFRWRSPQDYLKLNLSNYEVFVDPLDARFFQVVNELTQPDAETQVLTKLLGEGDTLIDIGANHGSFSIVASKLVGKTGLVVAVEPQPRLAKAVKKSLAKNSLGHFQVYPVAVGNTEGEIELLLPKGTSGSAGIFPEHSATHDYEAVKVPIKRFADLAPWQNFPGKVVLKLDIEGSESAFLAGAKPMIMALKPPLIIEIHPGTLKASQTTGSALKTQLQELGYTQYAEMHQLDERSSLADLSMTTQRNMVLFMT
jgi:FkbM family methyltransferase